MYEKDLAATLARVATRGAGRGFTFDDLARAARMQHVTIGEVADWLAQARGSGFVEDLGFDDHGPLGHGPRRYRVAGTAATAANSASA